MSEELLNQMIYYLSLDIAVFGLIYALNELRELYFQYRMEKMSKLNYAIEDYLFDCKAREQLERYQEQEDLMWIKLADEISGQWFNTNSSPYCCAEREYKKWRIDNDSKRINY